MRPLTDSEKKELVRRVTAGELFADYTLEISEFRAQTLATDPEDFQNFETFSMAMADKDYIGDNMMVILCDRYGNEKTLLLGKGDFAAGKRRR